MSDPADIYNTSPCDSFLPGLGLFSLSRYITLIARPEPSERDGGFFLFAVFCLRASKKINNILQNVLTLYKLNDIMNTSKERRAKQ